MISDTHSLTFDNLCSGAYDSITCKQACLYHRKISMEVQLITLKIGYAKPLASPFFPRRDKISPRVRLLKATILSLTRSPPKSIELLLYIG